MKTIEIQEVIAPLPLEERNLLLTLEEKAEKAKGEAEVNFKLFGKILFDICERKLYRGEYATFGAYVTNRWKLSRSRAYQIMDARETFELLSTVVDIPTERAAREISDLPDEDKMKVAEELKKSGDPITRTTIHNAALKVSKKKREAEKKKQERAEASVKKKAAEIAKREAKQKKKEPAKPAARGGLAAEVARANNEAKLDRNSKGRIDAASDILEGKETMHREVHAMMIRQWWETNSKKLAKAKPEAIVKKIIALFV
jgi:hypothetical protein